MTAWAHLVPSADGTHHVDARGTPAYAARFDEVLKFHSPGLAPVRRGSNAWHVDAEGGAAYTRRFERTFGFYDGLAAVIADDGWHHVRPSGEDAYRGRYAWCGNFQGGRCTVRMPDGCYMHITADGEPAYEARWRYSGDFRDGVAVVQAEDGRSSHIDSEGALLHARWFLDLDVFHKGYARARDEDGWTHVDRAGEPRYRRRFASVEPFYNGQARVERFDGGLEVIDERGHRVVELRPARRSEFASLSGDLVGFWRTQTIGAAVELGVFEALPASADQIAQRCGLPPTRTHRLLKALGELALVESERSGWRVTARGEYLRAEHPLTLADAAREYAGPFSRTWEMLSTALRAEGGWRAADVFGEVARDAGRLASHHRMLRSYARHDYWGVPAALDLRAGERIIDAGGGLGTMASLVLDAFPGLQVVVLDLPEVVEHAQRERAAESGLQWRGCDIFGHWGLQADAVVLARVLHDWEDGDAIRILRRAREALPTGGRLYVVEMLLFEGGASGGLCDLHLLVITGGRERTAAEYGQLFLEAGFDLREVRPAAALPAVLVGVAR